MDQYEEMLYEIYILTISSTFGTLSKFGEQLA